MYQLNCSDEHMSAFQEVLGTLCADMHEYGMEEDARVLESLKEVIDNAKTLSTSFVVEGMLDNGASVHHVKIAVSAKSSDEACKVAKSYTQTDSETRFEVNRVYVLSTPLVSCE